MDFIMIIPGLKDCLVTKVEERDGNVEIYVEMERPPMFVRNVERKRKVSMTIGIKK